MTTDTEGPTALAARLDRLEAEVADQRRFLQTLLEAAAWATLAAPAGVLLIVMDRPRGLPWPLVFNAAHAVFSAVVTLVALRLSRRLLARVLRRSWAHYAVALGAAALVGGGLEVAQLVGPGDASVKDLVRDGLGALAAAVFALSQEDVVAGSERRAAARGLRLVAAALAVLAILPPLRAGVALAWRYQSVPALADFESSWEERFVSAEDGATLRLVAPPPAFTRASGAVGRVSFTGDQYPKLEIGGLLQPWSPESSLVFEVYSEAAQPFRLELRVHDKGHGSQLTDRFNTTVTVPPGGSTIAIPIEHIRRGPRGREMDLARLESIILFAGATAGPLTLYLDSVRIE